MENLTWIDRMWFEAWNGSSSLLMDRLMLDVTTWWVWIPLYLALIMLIIQNNETIHGIGIIIGTALLCFAMTEISADVIIKPLVGRLRPCQDPAVDAIIVNGYRPTGFSFLSAHAANTFGIFVFISQLIKSRSLTFSLLSWTLINCLSRIYLGAHYPFDVLCGIACGALMGWISYQILQQAMKHIIPRTRYVSHTVTSSGYASADVNKVIAILMLTYIAIIIHTSITA